MIDDEAIVYMSVHGLNDGEITITEAKKLEGGDYHRGFTPHRQTYRFVKNGLRITGTSQKGDPYTVTIVPLA